MTSDSVLRCYRGACNAPADVRGYNRVTHGLYCLGCARAIDENPHPNPPGGPLFPLLWATVEEGGMWAAGVIAVRQAQVETPNADR